MKTENRSVLNLKKKKVKTKVKKKEKFFLKK